MLNAASSAGGGVICGGVWRLCGVNCAAEVAYGDNVGKLKKKMRNDS